APSFFSQSGQADWIPTSAAACDQSSRTRTRGLQLRFGLTARRPAREDQVSSSRWKETIHVLTVSNPPQATPLQWQWSGGFVCGFHRFAWKHHWESDTMNRFFGNLLFGRLGGQWPSRETTTVFREQAGAALSGDREVAEAMPS